MGRNEKLRRIGREIVKNPYLATKGTETERIKEATLTDLTSIGDTFTRPWLRPFIQEHNSSTVDDVRLNSCYVQIFLNLRNSNHIMVR